MEVNINIAAILNEKPTETKLWSPMLGDCIYCYNNTYPEEIIIAFTDKNGEEKEWTFSYSGRTISAPDTAEVCLFPSKQMQDWSKFAWKKGDVLVSNDGKQECIFDGWYNKDYTQARVKYWLDTSNENNIKCLEENQPLTSVMFKQEDKEKIENYINTIEEWYGGKKLNRETLEIEKPAFEIGNLYVFNEQDEGGNVTVIGKLIGKNESKDTLTFGNQYEIETEKFVTDQAFDLRISVHEELREATEGEYCTFQEACTLWEKKAKGQPDFKTFDKVLVRDSDTEEWEPAIFLRMSKEEEKKELPYQVFSPYYGFSCETAQCIPYEGSEHLAFTSDPF